MTMSFYEQSMKIATHEYKFFHSIYCVSVRRWATSKEKESHKNSNSPKGMWRKSIRFLTIWHLLILFQKEYFFLVEPTKVIISMW